MGMRTFILLLGIVLFPVSVLAAGMTGVVDFVPDGDTVVLENDEVVRLVGIDAPEIGKDGKPDQYFAAESRASLESLTLHKQIDIRIVGPERDRYGRLLGVILLPDGRNVNEQQLLGGYAFYYHFNDNPGWLVSTYIGLQRSAIRRKAGFWTVILELPEASKPWVGFPKSRRAEPARGSKAGAKRAGLKWFEDLEQVFRRGYCPTRRSTPWPDTRL